MGGGMFERGDLGVQASTLKAHFCSNLAENMLDSPSTTLQLETVRISDLCFIFLPLVYFNRSYCKHMFII